MSSSSFSVDEVKDFSGLINRGRGQSDPVSAFLWENLSKSEQSWLMSYQPTAPNSDQTQEVMVLALQKIIEGPCIYKVKRFKGVSLRPETTELIKLDPKGPTLAHLNRLLLEDAYPLELSRRQNMDRRVSFLIGLDGKIIQVTESPDPAVHVKELAAALAKLRDKGSP
jgi:hypothetical protein